MDEAPIRTVGDLPERAPLWRYIRLSSLLTLLQGTVFVPSIKTLQGLDPNEAEQCCAKTKHYFQNLSEDDKSLLLSFATKQESSFIALNPTADHWVMFSEIWIRQLANRRCAWCWYHGNIESMAQWHIYARDGVAIRTNPRRIRESFSVVFADRGIISPVVYDDQMRDDDMLFLRPYLQKQKCYQHEREVRVVFPREALETAGTKFQINGRRLIDAIMLSPLLPQDEARELVEALNGSVNSEGGAEVDQRSKIPIYLSFAKMRLPKTFADSFRLPDQTGITNFGRKNMPFLLTDNILREYKEH